MADDRLDDFRTFEARLGRNQALTDDYLRGIKRRGEEESRELMRQGANPQQMMEVLPELMQLQGARILGMGPNGPQIQWVNEERKEQIEQMVENIIRQEYGPLIDALQVDMDIKLMSQADPEDTGEMQGSPQPLPEVESEEVTEEDIIAEVDKRKLVNNITQGSAKNTHRLIHLYRQNIEDIHPRLFAIGDLIIKTQEAMEWDPRNPMNQQQGGQGEIIRQHLSGYAKVEFNEGDEEGQEGEEEFVNEHDFTLMVSYPDQDQIDNGVALIVTAWDNELTGMLNRELSREHPALAELDLEEVIDGTFEYQGEMGDQEMIMTLRNEGYLAITDDNPLQNLENLDAQGVLDGDQEAIQNVEQQLPDDYSGATLKARAIDFVVLLHESVKAIYEMLGAAGIPKDKEIAQVVLDNTDSLQDEFEDLKYGVYIRRDVLAFVSENDKIMDMDNGFEWVWGRIVEMPARDFLDLFKGIVIEDYRDQRLRVNVRMTGEEFDIIEGTPREVIDQIIDIIDEEVKNWEQVDREWQADKDSDKWKDEYDSPDDEYADPDADDEDKSDDWKKLLRPDDVSKDDIDINDYSTWKQKDLIVALNKALDDGDTETLDKISKYLK